ncbi:MAG: hypothetical protein J6C99_00285 [Lachnospiraceae bacterium]|nr:hypothetical protein [Lachnospiraceae bacterium]
MGAGLSMASVNKIKELANSREYSLALELVEHQDLSKSLNPQFLRLCGEIYIKNNRYEDARRCLIMAHRLAPESKRIMYVFVELYLRMGYFELAKTYYDMYMFDAGSYDSRQMEYVWTKHEHPDALKDMEQLIASYMHNLDYDWSFELYLVYKKEEKKEEAHSLAELYAASFKNSENSDRICAIEKGKESADTYFDVYASVQQEDNDERYDALRSEEAELLAADDLRMHPKEAEITVMYEDAFTPAGSEKKVQKMLKKQDREEERKEKKLLKEQRKQEKKLEKEAAKAENPEEETTLEASAAEETKPETVAETVTEETKPETAVEAVAEETKPETAVEAVAEETKPETAVETVTEETKPETAVETVSEETKPETTVEAAAEETKPETAVEAVAEETKPETAVEATAEKEEIEEAEIEKSKKRGLFSKIFRKKKEVEDDTTEYAELVQTSESEIIDADQDDRPSENADAEKAAETETVHAESETDSNETIDTMTTGQANDMRHKSKTMAKNVVVVDDDNDFEAEADTIEELAAKEKSDVEKKIEDKKPAFEFQTVELAPDDFEDQFQVDDFSDKLDAEFGEMKSYEPEPRIEIEEPIIEEPEAEAEEPEVETEELEIKEPEVEIEEPEAETEEPEVEPELEVEEPEVEIEESEAETEPELEIEEPEVEIEEPEVEPEPESIIEESETEPELEIEEPEVEIEEPEVEPEPESIIEESETEPELEIEEPEVEIEEPEVEPELESIIEESETEPELEIEEPEAEAEEPEVESEPEAEKPEFRVAPFTTKPEKKKLDFPVFKSSLFPDYHKEVKNVENNFDEIMEEAQDKMTENMRKEAQMQKEAEELLASLGISLNSIPAPAVKEEQPGQQGPSRDELKASLKIDTNKKNLLKRIKEYR